MNEFISVWKSIKEILSWYYRKFDFLIEKYSLEKVWEIISIYLSNHKYSFEISFYSVKRVVALKEYILKFFYEIELCVNIKYFFSQLCFWFEDSKFFQIIQLSLYGINLFIKVARFCSRFWSEYFWKIHFHGKKILFAE